MTVDAKTIAENYYRYIAEKNKEAIEALLHPDVAFESPLKKLKGKKTVLEAICGFMYALVDLSIRKKFGSENEAVIIYDSTFSGSDKVLKGASLVQTQNDLIVSIELFFDASGF